MREHDISPWRHEHLFTHGGEQENERRVLGVVMLTSVMMVTEIVGGWLFNSMAVLADGWHMSTHALALAIGVFAYRYARTHARNSAYSFGTGKVHALGSFSSAVILAVVALMVFGQSAWKLYRPEVIHYNEALLVATLSLMVNTASVFLLQDRHEHDHHHDHEHAHHHDTNLKAAYAHVIADAFTSLLAIVALLLGKYLGWQRVDPLMGIVGSGVIASWSWSLIRATTDVLLDRQPDPALAESIRAQLEADGDTQVADLHLWHVAPGRLSAIVSLVAHNVRPSEHYKKQLSSFGLAHTTIEVNQCTLHHAKTL